MAGSSNAESDDSDNVGLVALPPLTLDPPEPDCWPIAYSVDANNDAIVLWSRGTRPGRWLVSRHHEHEIFATVETNALSWRHEVFIQPLPDGEMLLATNYCAWRETGADRNAVVIDSSGRVIAEETMGNGIEHLLADSAGNVWVGYSDEGIFGSGGWNRPGPDSIGAAGLVRFDRRLQKIWEHEGSDLPGALPFIDDCYALNVSDDQVHAYVYNAFCILHVRDDQVAMTATDVRGAQEVLVDGAHVALLGGYTTDAERVSLGVIDGGRYVQHRRSELQLDRVPRLGRRPTVVARGPRLNRFSFGEWLRYTLPEPTPQ